MSEQDLFKLILYYDVDPEHIQDYYKFVMGRFLPMLQKMGLEMTEAWSVMYGNAPNRQICLVGRGKHTVLDILDSETWITLSDELNEFVDNFESKVVPFREGFQV